ncbi:MAG: hypothetical protein DHS20C18_48860 [Saprospiraceae bacterium]|nr:MAG: hypothetical protein DHS20C18_48860 [Saprospiraceae bacterium]
MQIGSLKNNIKTAIHAGRRRWKLLIGLFLLGTTLLIFLFYFLWFKPILHQKILVLVQQELADGGPAQCESLGYSLWGNRIWVAGLNFERRGKGQPASCQAQIEDIDLRGIDWWSLYFDEDLFLDEIHISSPKIKMIGQPFSHTSNQPTRRQNFQFHIGRILIEGGSLEYFDAADTTKAVLMLDSFRVLLTDIFPAGKNSQNSFEFEGVELDFQQFNYLTESHLYAIKADQISARSKDRSIRFIGLHYQPQVNRERFSQLLGKQKTQLDASSQFVVLQEVDLPRLLLDKEIDCRLMNMEGFQFKAFKDKNYPDVPELHALPHSVLMDFDRYFQIDTIRIQNGRIDYEERGLGETSISSIYFDQLYASIYNLTNNKSLLEKQAITVDTRSKFMGTGELSMQFRFFPLTADSRYTYQGKLQEFTFENINKVLDPRSALVLKSGHVQQLQFEVEANKTLSKGTMDFEYSNLKAHVLNKETNRKKGLLTFVANLATRKENKRSDKDYRQGQIYFERTPNKSITHDLWQSVFSGIRSTVLTNILLKDELETSRGK